MVEALLPQCAHQWDIDPPNGHTSPGTCRHCGETRDFLNSCDEVLKKTPVFRPLDFRAKRQKEEVSVVKKDVHKRHNEVDKRWPEIKRTIEESGSINRAALVMGHSYTGIMGACKRHGFDPAPYQALNGTGKAPARVRPEAATTRSNGAKPSDNIGEALIGVGLVIIGAWLKSREG